MVFETLLSIFFDFPISIFSALPWSSNCQTRRGQRIKGMNGYEKISHTRWFSGNPAYFLENPYTAALSLPVLFIFNQYRLELTFQHSLSPWCPCADWQLIDHSMYKILPWKIQPVRQWLNHWLIIAGTINSKVNWLARQLTETERTTGRQCLWYKK